MGRQILLTIAFTTIFLAASGIPGNAQGSVPSQSAKRTDTQAASPSGPAIPLEATATVPLTNLYTAKVMGRIRCGSDDRLYASIFAFQPDAIPDVLITPTIIAIDHDGKVTVVATLDRITDLKAARLINSFLAENGIFLLIRTSTDSDSSSQQKNSGLLPIQKSDSELEWIARFDRDGTYRGSTRIDIPFSGLQLGIFPTGQFLISGIDPLNHAKTALLNSSGVLDRYIVFPEEHRNKKSQASREPSQGEFLFGAISSQLIADRNEILLLPPDSDAVFRISASGMAERVKLHPKHAGILSLRAVPEGWVTESISRKDEKQNAGIALYARSDGHLIREYTYSDSHDVLLGCIHDGEWTFLRREKDEKLALITTSTAEPKTGLDHKPD